MTDEKANLLLKYMAGWRRTYRQAAWYATMLDSPERSKRLARRWYKAHQFHCDHFPKCRDIRDFWRRVRNPKLGERRRQVKEKRDIHSIAFAHAWHRGILRHRSFPYAHAGVALVPGRLVIIEPGLVALRLFPRVEVAFRVTALEGMLLEGTRVKPDRAFRLLLRKTGWYLEY